MKEHEIKQFEEEYSNLEHKVMRGGGLTTQEESDRWIFLKELFRKIRRRRKNQQRRQTSDFRKKQHIRERSKVISPKPSICQWQGCDRMGEHRHHLNYEDPKAFVWLCAKHHGKIHSQIKYYCIFPGCDAVGTKRYYCGKHYQQILRKKNMNDNANFEIPRQEDLHPYGLNKEEREMVHLGRY